MKLLFRVSSFSISIERINDSPPFKNKKSFGWYRESSLNYVKPEGGYQVFLTYLIVTQSIKAFSLNVSLQLAFLSPWSSLLSNAISASGSSIWTIWNCRFQYRFVFCTVHTTLYLFVLINFLGKRPRKRH